jgi:hypothetical protein
MITLYWGFAIAIEYETFSEIFIPKGYDYGSLLAGRVASDG